MKIKLWITAFGILLILALAAFPTTSVTANSDNACWGQATKVFTQMYGMGEHASQEATPRLGLANLARALYADGVIAEPSMQALGQFVSSALGLSIEACQ